MLSDCALLSVLSVSSVSQFVCVSACVSDGGDLHPETGALAENDGADSETVKTHHQVPYQ